MSVRKCRDTGLFNGPPCTPPEELIEYTTSKEDLRPEYFEQLSSTIIAAVVKSKDNPDTHHNPSIAFQMGQEITDMD